MDIIREFGTECVTFINDDRHETFVRDVIANLSGSLNRYDLYWTLKLLCIGREVLAEAVVEYLNKEQDHAS